MVDRWFKIGDDEFRLVVDCTNETIEEMSRLCAIGGKVYIPVKEPSTSWLAREVAKAEKAYTKAGRYLELLIKIQAGSSKHV